MIGFGTDKNNDIWWIDIDSDEIIGQMHLEIIRCFEEQVVEDGRCRGNCYGRSEFG